MHRRSTKRTRPTTRFLAGLGAVLPFLIAVPATMAGDQPAAPYTPSDREAFLAGTSKDCRGCDLRNAKLKRRDLRGVDLTGADLTGAVLHRAQPLVDHHGLGAAAADPAPDGTVAANERLGPRLRRRRPFTPDDGGEGKRLALP